MSIYISIFIILLSILWHSGNDHNVIKPDEIIFPRAGKLCLNIQLIFILIHSLPHRDLVKQLLHVWQVDFLMLLYLVKEELLAQKQLAASCVARIYLATIISKRRVKEMKERQLALRIR